ncbi:MAG: transglutaminase domain-containing protein, partial [bacterium]
MRLRIPLLLLLAILLTSTPSFAIPGSILDSLNAPGTMPTGLAFDGTNLWMADRLSDSLYAIDPSTGEVKNVLPAPGYMVTGLAWDGKALWCMDIEESRVSRVDVNSGVTISSFESPLPMPADLAWDGNYLWIVDPTSDILAKISTDDGTTVVEYPAPSSNATGLTWWKGYLWCADRVEDRIYLIAPDHDGEVVLSMDAPAPHAQGLAAVGDDLFCVDYQTDRIYRLATDDGKTIQQSDKHTLDVKLLYEFRNYGPGEVPELDVYIAVPHDMPNQVLHGDPTFTPAPKEFLEDRWGQRVAHFRLENPAPGVRNRITMEATADLYDARQFVFPHHVGKLKDIPKEIRQLYLVDEDKYRINDPIIQNAVKAAIGDETNPYWMMRRIHKYIRDRLYYELAGGWNVAPRVLERGNGSCSEYTFVFISMCRAAGIPARYVGSVVVRGDEASTDLYFHRWSQVYMPGFGWMMVDPQGGDQETPSKVGNSIGHLSNRFLITTESG